VAWKLECWQAGKQILIFSTLLTYLGNLELTL
jgi:hypothetical protein